MQHKTLCEHCDTVIEFDHDDGVKSVRCPNCQSEVTVLRSHSVQAILAISLSGILMMPLAILLPFLSMQSYGINQGFSLLQAIFIIFDENQAAFAWIFLLTVIIIPCCFLLLVCFSYAALGWRKNNLFWYRARRLALLLLSSIRIGVMADIFLVAVIVSLVKVLAMADIAVGFGFWCFCLTVLCSAYVFSNINLKLLWQVNSRGRSLSTLKDHRRGIEQGLTSCHRCGSVATNGQCACCGAKVAVRKPRHKQHIVAWVITAFLCYIPANILPIMQTKQMTETISSTIVEGVILLWQMQSYPVAIVIFFASVLVPIVKLLAMLFMCYVTDNIKESDALSVFKLYRAVEFFGKWSMIDVFVIAVLVALVQIDGLLEIHAGPAVVYFAAMVAASLCASSAFDPRTLWDKK